MFDPTVFRPIRIRAWSGWTPAPIVIEGQALAFSPRAGGEHVSQGYSSCCTTHPRLRLGHALFTTWPNSSRFRSYTSAKEARKKTITEEQRLRLKIMGGKAFKQNPLFRSERRLSNVGKIKRSQEQRWSGFARSVSVVTISIQHLVSYCCTLELWGYSGTLYIHFMCRVKLSCDTNYYMKKDYNCDLRLQ